MAYTFFAPFCNIQSVNPPVEEPTSIHILFSKFSKNLSTAFSNFKPPLLTYFKVFPLTSIGRFSSKLVPALSSFIPSTYTIPDIIIAFAFSLEVANPFFTNKISSLSFTILTP